MDLDRPLPIAERLDLSQLEDFHRVQTHAGWMVFKQALLDLRKEAKEEVIGSSNRDDAWEGLLRLRGIDRVIVLLRQITNRRETERHGHDDERRHIERAEHAGGLERPWFGIGDPDRGGY